MRPAPRPIPKDLPPAADAVAMISREVLDRPDVRLADWRVGELIERCSSMPPVYLTGSNVWLRAVYGGVPGCDGVACRAWGCTCRQLDYDIVLGSAKAAEDFIETALVALNQRIGRGRLVGPHALPAAPRYTRVQNNFGNGRIAHPDGNQLIDVWHLEPGETIGELLMGYPEAYQRAAISVGPGSPTEASLFRLARPVLRGRTPGCYGKKQGRTSGAIDDVLADLRDGINSPKKRARYPGRA